MCIFHNDVIHNDSKSIANVFNEFFTSIGTKLAKEIIEMTNYVFSSFNDAPKTCGNSCGIPYRQRDDFKVVLYADDTLIYYSAKVAQDVETCLNNDVKSVAQWFHSNLLTLNCGKSRFLLFGSRQRLKLFNTTSVQINEWPLERESSLKYLGVILNEDMSWNDHI